MRVTREEKPYGKKCTRWRQYIVHRKSLYFLSLWLLVLLSVTGCQKTIPLDRLIADKKTVVERNLTLDQAIRQQKLEQADNLYLDYRGEHPDSRKLPSLMLRLSQAHIKQKEYLLARYYAESYIRDYPDGRRVDRAWFLRLKALFYHAISKGSADTLLEQFREEAEGFLKNPLYRKYHAKARVLLKKAEKVRYERNEALATYYEKLGKHKAAAFYREQNKMAGKTVKKHP